MGLDNMFLMTTRLREIKVGAVKSSSHTGSYIPEERVHVVFKSVDKGF